MRCSLFCTLSSGQPFAARVAVSSARHMNGGEGGTAVEYPIAAYLGSRSALKSDTLQFVTFPKRAYSNRCPLRQEYLCFPTAFRKTRPCRCRLRRQGFQCSSKTLSIQTHSPQWKKVGFPPQKSRCSAFAIVEGRFSDRGHFGRDFYVLQSAFGKHEDPNGRSALPSAKVALLRLSQLSNALSPIVVTPAGMFMFFKPLLQNA